MTSGRLIRQAIRWFIALAVPFLLVMGCLRLLLSYEFLRFEYTRPGFPADSYGFTTADRLEYGMYAISFLFSAEGVDTLASIMRPPDDMCRGSSPCPLFNARELGHLVDVKDILRAGFSFFFLCLFVAILGALSALYRHFVSHSCVDVLREVRLGLTQGAVLTLMIILALGVFGAAAWDRAFDIFHELFFPVGSWRFPFSDSLIRLYPEQLFVDAALAIGIFTSSCALLILVLLRLWERYCP